MEKSRKERLLEKARKEKWSLGFLILLFSLISFYTSYTGLIKLAGVLESNYILKIFMGLLVGALQFALVFSINAFYIRDIFKRNGIKAIALLLIYIITMILSVTFSFSYWYEGFSAESYAKRSSELQLNKVKESLFQAQSSFSVMERSLSTLSDYSATKSEREKNYGRTCDPRVGSGEGVYTWLRADDSKYSKNYSKEIRDLKRDLNKEIQNVSAYLEKFDPKGDVVKFNREVNNKITQINSRFFQNQTLQNLKKMLISRSGSNRKHISVISRKNATKSIVSCLDRDFTIGANSVIRRIEALRPIEPLSFFDMSDSKKLFGRTTGVLFALIDPSSEIKSTSNMSNPNDITSADLYAVSAGFVIDFLILLITLYAKKPKDNRVPLDVVQKILNGEYGNEVLSSLKLFTAELHTNRLIAIPDIIEDNELIDNVKLLMLYMEQQKLVKLYVNGIKANRLNKYFNESLKESYPNSSFRVYKLNKKRFNAFLLQNIEVGA